MTNAIKNYYRESNPNIGSITDISHRHFRFMLRNGRFLKVRDRIRNEDVLKKWLLRYCPTDVYYSVSCWLKPEILGRREKTPLSANIFLSSDIVFDIDNAPFSKKNLEKSRKETLKLIDFLDCRDYRIKYIAFSGSKGFHVICKDPNKYENNDPLKREDMARRKRKEILEMVESQGIETDGKITIDTRRIIRVPGTINSKTGFVCTTLSREDIKKQIGEILKQIPRVIINSQGIPVLGDCTLLRIGRKIPGLINQMGVKQRSHPSPSPRFSYVSFLVNCVPGIKRHITFLEYPANRNTKITKRIENELMEIQDMYDLSDIYLFKSKSRITAISLRTFQMRRLEKILKASSSVNYNSLIKYRQLFFRVGPKRDPDQKIVEDVPEYIKTIKTAKRDGTNNPGFISKPHYSFFEGFGIPMCRYRFMHGKGNVFLTHTIIEN